MGEDLVQLPSFVLKGAGTRGPTWEGSRRSSAEKAKMFGQKSQMVFLGPRNVKGFGRGEGGTREAWADVTTQTLFKIVHLVVVFIYLVFLFFLGLNVFLLSTT